MCINARGVPIAIQFESTKSGLKRSKEIGKVNKSYDGDRVMGGGGGDDDRASLCVRM